MYLGCSSQSYDDEIGAGRLTLADWFRLCAGELGLRAVELEDKHIGEPTPFRLAALRETAGRSGLEITSIALMNNFGLTDDRRRAAEESRTIAWMPAAQALGSRYLRTFAGWPEGDRAARWPGMITALRRVCAEAEAAAVRLVLENHNHHGFVRTSEDVEQIVREVGSPALGLLLDTGNFLDGTASITRTAGLARHVHAKFTDVGPDGRDRGLDYPAVLGILRAANYRGCLSVEYEGREPGRTAVPRIVRFLRQEMASRSELR